jgi:acyl transferase domain-containing protein
VKSPIAIVGMACRLPGADGLLQYWDLLAAGRDAVADMPADRLDRELYYCPEKGVRGKTYSVRGGCIPERPLDLTRAPFTAADLSNSDPCHQIMCEVAATALRHAGLDPFALPRQRTGVYVGHSGGSTLGGDITYGTLAEETVDHLRDIAAFAQLPADVQQQVLQDLVFRLRGRRIHRDALGMPDTGAHGAAGLVARVLKLSGPQMAIDAACASSLVALALGAVALQQGEIDAAIVGGASFNKCDSLILFSHAQSCSASRSRPFDEAADGLISAEGYVALVIKTLDRAIADRDPIHAVIRGIGMSSDGRGRSLWAPRKEGQVQAMRRAYAAGIDPQRVGYVEAHATSTQVGDATEVEALREFFDSVASGRKIPIGSVKSNIGHTLETAGLAGLVKSVLAMQHGVVPSSINVTQLNREIPWDQLPFFVARENLPWSRGAQAPPRRAAVNAFGIGGLNVHVVVDEYDPHWNYRNDYTTSSANAPTSTDKSSAFRPAVAVDASGRPADHAALPDDPVAVIGRGVILPGAFSAAALEQLIGSSGTQIQEAPAKRWRKKIGVQAGIAKAWHSTTCRGGYIEGYEYDWRKFKIPPKQIDQANPLQFMLLDAARQALEEAGYQGKDFDHARTAVVVGSAFGAEFGNQLGVGLRLPELKRDVQQLLVQRGMTSAQAARAAQELEDLLLRLKPALLDETGSFTASTLASRISKTLDLMGGAMAIDTNDCSALAALDAACGLLRSGACSMVLCAGASRAMDLPSYELLALRGWLAGAEGPANPFLERNLPGEGVAMVLLKRLSDARRDGDKVLAIVEKITAHNLHVSPSMVAHAYHDPLLAKIGHTQAAQGLVSVLSAIATQSGEQTIRSVTDQGLQYSAQLVVGSTLPTKPQPAASPPAVATSAPVAAARATAPSATATAADSRFRIVRMGASDFTQLEQRLAAAKLQPAEWFGQSTKYRADDAVRIAIVARDVQSLASKLDLAMQMARHTSSRAALEEQGVYLQTAATTRPRVAFLFPGQGSQYPDMLRGLVQVSPAARARMREADAVLHRLTGESFAALAWGDAAKLGHDVWATQASILLADVMMADALQERGVTAEVVCGHSFGEFAALTVAGAWSLEQALRLTQVRANAINASRSGHGGLMSVDAPADRVAALIAQHGCRVFVTHYNAPQQTVVGGDDRSLAEFSALLVSEGLTPRQLPVPSAFHTPLLADTQDALRQALAAEPLLPPKVPLLSTVTNRYAAEPDEIRANLVAQMVEPVRYMQLVQRLVGEGTSVFVEVGPQQVLTRLTRQVLNGSGHTVLIATDHPKRDAEEMLLRVQAALEGAGVESPSHRENTAALMTPGTPMQRLEIEHFDATARRRERRRGALPLPAAPQLAEKPSPPEQFDATALRREARRNGVHAAAEPPAVVKAPATNGRASLPHPLPPVAETSPAATSSPQLERFLIDFVVEQTGYPAEMIDLDWDMEADLGIDSIKRAQLFGELREFFDLETAGKGGSFSLDRFRTLRQVLDFLQDLPGKGTWLATAPATPNESAPQPVAAPALPYKNGHNGHHVAKPLDLPPPIAAAGPGTPRRTTAELETFLVNFVVDQTGYPPEIVELDADLEADLGIDSIKKAQLFGELREHFTLPLEQMSRLKLAEYRTLRQVLAILQELQALADPTGGAPLAAPSSALAEPTSPAASTRTMPAAPSPASLAFDRGLSRGRAEAARMHAWLRQRADEAWSPDAAASSGACVSTATLLAPELEFSAEHWEELQGMAEAAGLHIHNVVAYQRYALQLASPSVNGHHAGGLNGHPDAWAPVGDLIAVEPAVASRYVLRAVESPQKAGSPRQPVWQGAAVILGNNAYAQAIKARFEREGRHAYLIAPSDDPLAAANELERIWQREPVCHLFIATPRDADAVTTLHEADWHRRRQRGLMSPFWLCQRWVKLVTEAGLMDKASLAALVSLGGDFGLSGNVVAAESGAVCGLLKAIIIESWVNGFRTLPVKMIDALTTASPEEVVEATWRELAVPSYDCEIGSVAGRRLVVRANKEAPQTSRRAPQPIARGSVWVCTGGARGITAYVVKELGERFGLKLHLVGTAPAPSIPDSWRDLTDTGLKALKLEVMQHARAVGRNPVKEWQNTEKALEIDRTVREFAAQGIEATYHSCDVSDRAALARVLTRIRDTDGPIEGILHGAGVGKDSRFDRKDPEKVSQCFQAKIDGALALMDLTRHDPVKHFVAFGSISGRFGANGHTDYSAANDMLCKLVAWYRQQRPEVHAVAFHWHAWGDVGMATKPETRLALELVDMQFMPAREGLAHLLRELAAGAPEGEVLITDDRYHRMFYPAETLSGSGEASGAPKFPLVDGGRHSQQGSRQLIEIDLDPTCEPFLVEHRLEDRPLLPVVVGMEMLAEAALRSAGRGRVIALHHVEALNGLRFFSDRAQTARLISEPQGAGNYRVELTADFLSRDGKLVEANRGYLRGTVEVTETPATLTATMPRLDERDWQGIDYAPRGSKFYLGPPLRACKQIRLGQGVLWGKIYPPMLQELAGQRRSADGWMVPSAALDACLYAVGMLAWTQVQPGPSLPFRFGRVALGRLPHPGEACLVEATFLRQEGRYADFNFTLFGSSGDVILQVNDYRIVYLA